MPASFNPWLKAFVSDGGSGDPWWRKPISRICRRLRLSSERRGEEGAGQSAEEGPPIDHSIT
jgi:hypothetical protein